jgi:uncharacterized protein (DUF1499 family)
MSDALWYASRSSQEARLALAGLVRHWRFAKGAAGITFCAAISVGCGAPPPPPPTLGVVEGDLARCPASPNCVHTGHLHPEGMQPLYLREEGGSTWDDVISVVEAMPRLTVVSVSARYIHVEEHSRMFRFIDDLELLQAEDREIVVRSASRLGRGDLGVNARRVERLRAALLEAGLLAPSSPSDGG